MLSSLISNICSCAQNCCLCCARLLPVHPKAQMAKDVKKSPEEKAATIDNDTQAPDAQATRNSTGQAAQRTAPVVAPSTVINIAVHSLLMVTVPFALFFAALLGGLDREYHWQCTAAVYGSAITTMLPRSSTAAAAEGSACCCPAALFKLTGGQVPRQDTKTYIGAGLAVLGVNLVS